MYEIIGSDIRNFLISVSAINTSDAIFSFVSLYTIKNPRSGVATMVGKVLDLDLNTFLLLIGKFIIGVCRSVAYFSRGFENTRDGRSAGADDSLLSWVLREWTDRTYS
ncbi:MAG: hypothetical protein B6U86_03160 [Candidatus Altiarchaeales archaeon ex4484_43]|nr:MAG: hypothetical protein B6U86_03160 [Candidatus Altiarchaeales archaeon ex4484_43]